MGKRMAIILVLSLLCLGGELHAKGKGSSGSYKSYRGGKAIDGDTFRYADKRYRMQGYSAPELGQPGSRQATRDLQKKLDSGEYEWKPIAKDVYGRTIVKEREK